MDRPDGFYVIALGGRDDLEKSRGPLYLEEHRLG
jgi:hypothetical protein